MHPDGHDYSDAEILSYFDQKYEQSSKGDYYIRGFQPVSQKTVLTDWKKIIHSVPAVLREAVREAQGECWRYSAQAVSMMRALGWKWSEGRGLGKARNGRFEPVMSGRGQAGTSFGLGYKGPEAR